MNFNLSFYKHEIIFRMNTVAICFTNRFETQLAVFEKNINLAIVGSSIEDFNLIHGDLKRQRIVPLQAKKINQTKLKRNPFNHMTVVLKKNIVIALGRYQDIPSYEDYYLWLKILNKYKAINLPNRLMFARAVNDMFGRRYIVFF